MKEVGTALIMYSQDYDEGSAWFYNNHQVVQLGIPLAGYWYWQLYPYTKSWGVFGCASCGKMPNVWDSDGDGILDVPDTRTYGYGIAWAHVAGCRGVVRRLPDYKRPSNTIFIQDSSTWGRGGGENVGYQDVYCPIGMHPLSGLHDCFRDNCSSGGSSGGPGPTWPATGWTARRHSGGANNVFMDGHAKWYKYERLRDGNKANDIWGHDSGEGGDRGAAGC
jgi:prepilin-type processing-associated H-X9-DG protein